DHGIDLLLVGRNLMRDVVRAAPADPRVAPDIDRLADEHQETSECNAAIDVAHRQVEHRHALIVHALGDRPWNASEQAEKWQLDEIDQGQQRRAQRPRLHHVRKQLNGNMRIAAGHHRATDEYHPHQSVARDLLGPGQAVIENIAREKLQEDDEGERPKERECKPIFRVVLDHDLGVLGFNQALFALKSLFLGHDPPRRAARTLYAALYDAMLRILFQRL